VISTVITESTSISGGVSGDINASISAGISGSISGSTRGSIRGSGSIITSIIDINIISITIIITSTSSISNTLGYPCARSADR
jgi:hypothetical protein